MSVPCRPYSIAALLGWLLCAPPVAAAEPERFALVVTNAFTDAPSLGLRWMVAGGSSLSLSYQSNKDVNGLAGGPQFAVATSSYAFAYRYSFDGADHRLGRLSPFLEGGLGWGEIDIRDPAFNVFLDADTDRLRIAAGVEFRFDLPLSIEVSGGWQRARTRYDDGFEVEVETAPAAEVGLNFYF